MMSGLIVGSLIVLYDRVDVPSFVEFYSMASTISI